MYFGPLRKWEVTFDNAYVPTGILYYIQVKRQLTYNPRLGRRSAAGAGGEECNEFQQRSPYSAVRCLGKKDMQYTPRLGRRSG